MKETDSHPGRLLVPRALLILLGGFLVAFSIIPMGLNILNVGMLAGLAIGFSLLCLGFLWPRAIRLWGRLVKGKCRAAAISILLVLAAGLTVFACSVGLVISGMYAPEEDCGTVVVLGCLVKGDTPSLLLRYRIDAAADYLDRHPASVCIVSGGQGARENITEASCMKRELIARGIEESRIYEEDRSTNTRENIRFSMDVMEAEGLPRKVAVVTNDFHVYRSRMVARREGLDAYGVPAKCRISSRVCYTLREGIGLIYYLLFE